MPDTAVVHIEPVLKDQDLIKDIQTANVRNGQFRLWWLGQSGFLVQWNGNHLLLDPYLSDALARKHVGTATPHSRITCRAVDPSQLNFVDVVALSNILPDHMDPDTLRPVMEADPKVKIIVPAAYRVVAAEKLGVDPKRLFSLDDGLSVEIGAFQVTAVPAAHGELEYDAAGHCKYLGFVVRFGRWTLYHSGDTIRYLGMAEGLRPFHIDVALLPIDGRPPGRGVPGNMNGVEAARLAHDMHAKFAIPCHYDMFLSRSASPEPFREEADHLGVRYEVLQCAQRWDSADYAWSY